ncbi:hypothetical protein EV189_2230 [Motilibacter rhizosphaerae]|uniref:HNH endonuclease n=1 Tax=Motilibacter rhizosphaerae TaxID=598652 RepID=A0A4Q7NNJ2_9ACTN|nr:hypothetical protein [Motilibacter rhizosphaerae]RZS86814.1 hypothetical protein EV189_2230 [Motilibacter rhizosphaerae]
MEGTALAELLLAGLGGLDEQQRVAGAALLDTLLVPDDGPLDLDGWTDRVLELLWRARGRPTDPVGEEVAALAAAGRAAGSLTAHGTAALLPARYAAARRRTALALTARSLPALLPQALADLTWVHRRLTQAELDARSRRVELDPAAARALREVTGVVRPLLQPDPRPPFVPEGAAALLREAQRRTCLGCGAPLRAGHDVVPLLPRLRLPLDSVAGLVAVCAPCARSRGTALPSLRVVWAWHRRPEPPDLPEPWEQERVAGALVAVVAALPAGVPLWAGRSTSDRSTGSEGDRLRALLAPA